MKQFIQNYLGDLKPHYARKLLNTARVKVFRAGETLIAEGKTTDFLAYVLDGQTTVLKNGQVINRCGADQILGELTFGRGLPATASVRAVKTTTCLVFDSNRLGQLLRRNRQIDDALKAAHFDNMRQKLLRSNSHTVKDKVSTAVA